MAQSAIDNLKKHYVNYLDTLNTRSWSNMHLYAADSLVHNDKAYTCETYTELLRYFTGIAPDQHYEAEDMTVELDPHGKQDLTGRLATRIKITVTPKETFLGVEPTGATISFYEYVFYWFEDGRIVKVKSLVDVETVREKMTSA